LDQLHSYRPELVLLDTFMPGMDGEEVLRRMKKSKHLHDVPVVMLDNESDPTIELNVFKQGAEDYICKPFAPAVLLHRIRRIVNFHRLEKSLQEEVLRQTKRTGRLSREIMEALSNTVEAKDLYTSGHSRRVAELAAELARRAGKTDTELRDIFAIGLLHDIGKVGISEDIINKDGKLSEEEYREMQRHTVIGYEILKIISTMPGLARGARWHHERYDGTGYPDGLYQDSIPEEARILAVADTYDAMTTARTYSSIRPLEEVRQEFLRCRGSQFDPYYADLMVQIIDERMESMGKSAR
jgi:putative nucleotidyltransferase with HDIG domain